MRQLLSFGDPEAIKRIICPSTLPDWDRNLIHGGLIEFSSAEAMVRALRYGDGAAIPENDPVALQLATQLFSEDWDIQYDLLDLIVGVRKFQVDDDI